MKTRFMNPEWRIIDKPGFESWYFTADIYDVEPLGAWLRANLEVYEANAIEMFDKSYHSIYIRFSCADDAALFKLTWC